MELTHEPAVRLLTGYVTEVLVDAGAIFAELQGACGDTLAAP